MQPQGFPDWLWICLGAVLPLLYQGFIKKLPGIIKQAVAWGASIILVLIVGLVFLHYSPGELLRAFAWIVAASQAVYGLMVKPMVAAIRAEKRF